MEITKDTAIVIANSRHQLLDFDVCLSSSAYQLPVPTSALAFLTAAFHGNLPGMCDHWSMDHPSLEHVMVMPEPVVIHTGPAGTPGWHKVTSSGSVTMAAPLTPLWGPECLIWFFSFIRSALAQSFAYIGTTCPY